MSPDKSKYLDIERATIGVCFDRFCCLLFFSRMLLQIKLYICLNPQPHLPAASLTDAHSLPYYCYSEVAACLFYWSSCRMTKFYFCFGGWRHYIYCFVWCRFSEYVRHWTLRLPYFEGVPSKAMGLSVLTLRLVLRFRTALYRMRYIELKFCLLICMGVKLGRWHCGRKVR